MPAEPTEQPSAASVNETAIRVATLACAKRIQREVSRALGLGEPFATEIANLDAKYEAAVDAFDAAWQLRRGDSGAAVKAEWSRGGGGGPYCVKHDIYYSGQRDCPACVSERAPLRERIGLAILKAFEHDYQQHGSSFDPDTCYRAADEVIALLLGELMDDRVTAKFHPSIIGPAEFVFAGEER